MKVRIRKEWREIEGEGWSLIARWENLWLYDVTEIVQRLCDCNKPKINYCYCITWHLSAPELPGKKIYWNMNWIYCFKKFAFPNKFSYNINSSYSLTFLRMHACLNILYLFPSSTMTSLSTLFEFGLWHSFLRSSNSKPEFK